MGCSCVVRLDDVSGKVRVLIVYRLMISWFILGINLNLSIEECVLLVLPCVMYQSLTWWRNLSMVALNWALRGKHSAVSVLLACVRLWVILMLRTAEWIREVEASREIVTLLSKQSEPLSSRGAVGWLPAAQDWVCSSLPVGLLGSYLLPRTESVLSNFVIKLPLFFPLFK